MEHVIRCLTSWIIMMTGVCLAAGGAEKSVGPSYRLRLEVVRTLPGPVIGSDTPGADKIPGGFEGGSSVKVMVDGKSEYHFFSHGYPKLDWSQSRLEHWMSSDGVNFRRVSVLLDNYRDEKAGMNHIFCSPVPFYDDKSGRWHLVFCEFVGPATWTGDSATIWRAQSKTPGKEGIAGPYDFAKRSVFVPKHCAKIGAITPFATACSAPFQVQDGRWAVFVSTDFVRKDEKTGARQQRWPVVLNFTSSLLGPYEPPQEAVVPPLIDPTGFIENPMPLKVRGPKSGRDYWVTVFDFLAPEVTAFTPKNIFGFSWSADGVNWPTENGQAVNIDAGLAAGERGWWRGAWSVRTPHQMIDEGDGTYSIYFTGGSADNHFSAFRAVGKVTVRLVEEESASRVAEDIDWKSMMVVAERKRDSGGGLLPLQSYDETIRRGMSFLLDDHLKWFKGQADTLRDEQGRTQMPWVYYSNLQHNGAPFPSSVDRFVSYPAFHHALLIRTFIGYWRYAGDKRALAEAVNLADWNIAHSTPADWPYGNFPWSTFQEKKPGGFRDQSGLMPDKAAIMGLAYLQLHEATGEARFLK